MKDPIHLNLNCGVEMAAAPMPGKHVVAMEFRILSGTAEEPEDKLGLARLVKETIDKGTGKRSGRELLDAFDDIGAPTGAWVGREAAGFTCICLPEFLEQAVGLHAEFLRTPTFPEDAVKTAIGLTEQEIGSLEDDPPSLADKYIERYGLGPVLGRCPLGERHTLAQIGREDLVQHWQQQYCTGRMQFSIAGAVDPDAVAKIIQTHFDGFGSAARVGRDGCGFTFEPTRKHYDKKIEQEQIALCFPGAAVGDDDYSAMRIMLGVLSGGMSGRLFTEVREKQGLAYDVHAMAENPRGQGMVFVAASCKPDVADQTFRTLLRELERLSEDLTDDEVSRARSRVIAREETMADMTRSRRGTLAADLFHHGRPRSIDERLAKIRKVTREDVIAYLSSHPRDRMSIVTLGPCGLADAQTADTIGALPNEDG